MQIYRTVPNSEVQTSFFRRYGKYAPYIATGVVLAQILSGFTESGLIYSNVRDATSVFGLTFSNIAGILGAFIGVALIELVGLRVALGGVVDAFLYKRWQGLDLLFSIALIVLAVVLIPSSFILSLQGGGQIVESLKDRTEQQRTTHLEEKQAVILAELDTNYLRNVSAINTTYRGLISSETEKASSLKVVKQQNYDFWKSKGERYKTRINNALVELQSVEADKTNKIAELKQRQAEELKELQTRYDREKATTKSDTKANITQSTGKIETKSAAFKTGTKYIVLIAMFFSVFGIVLQRIYLKGSGIEELAEPNNFYFSPSLLSEKFKLNFDRKQIARRNRIAEKRQQLPELIPYASSLPIHDFAALERTILQLKLNDGEQKQTLYLNSGNSITNTDNLEQQIADYTAAQIELESNNNHTAAKAMELQAKQVIRLYLTRNDQKTKAKDIDNFQNKVIQHLNEPKKFENPFNEYRQQIGFKQQGSVNPKVPNTRRPNATVTNATVSDMMGQCVECGKTYPKKVRWQKFCSSKGEGNCKDAYHSKQHGGTKFNPKKYHKTKHRL